MACLFPLGYEVFFNPLQPGRQGKVKEIQLCRKSIILAQRRRGAEKTTIITGFAV